MTQTRVLIVEEQAIVRRGLRTILSLEPDIAVVGEAQSPDEALRLMSKLNPDVALVDGDRTAEDVFAFVRSVRGEHPRTGVILLAAFTHRVLEAYDAGIDHYILKDASPEQIAAVVRRAGASEERGVAEDARDALVRALQEGQGAEMAPLHAAFDLVPRALRAQRSSLLLLRGSDGEMAIARAAGMAEAEQAGVRVPAGVGVAGYVLQTMRPVLVQDIALSERFRPGRAGVYRTGSFIAVPLAAAGRACGVLSVADREDGRPFAQSDLETLQLYGRQIGLGVEALLAQWEMRQQSMVDRLTGLYTRRFLEVRLLEEVERARRYRRHVSLIRLDLDGFKGFNERHGHGCGDLALREVAQVLRCRARQGDVVCRCDSDEFALLLPDAGRAQALTAARRMRAAIDEHMFSGAGLSGGARLSASLGIASYPLTAADSRQLLRQAAGALQHARAAGSGIVAHQMAPAETRVRHPRSAG